MKDQYEGHDCNEMYLDLLKKTLTRYQLEANTILEPVGFRMQGGRVRLIAVVNYFMGALGLGIGRLNRVSDTEREAGLDWPLNAETMVGLKRLDQLHDALDHVRRDEIPGDIMETGVWRGGAMIFAAGYLKVHQMDRLVYVADSFEGLPKPDQKYPMDRGDIHHQHAFLSVDDNSVKENFRKYGLLENNIIFVKGFFENSLKGLDVNRLSVLRLDGDMYSSTIQVLESMYSRVSLGGFVIIDDYSLQGARAAVLDFLAGRGLEPEIRPIDSTGVFWRVN